MLSVGDRAASKGGVVRRRSYYKFLFRQEPPVADAKLAVIYPRPKDVDVFEKVYQTEHLPLAVAKLAGKTKIVATKILGSPDGLAPFHRIAVYFPSMQALEPSDRGKERRARFAVKISTGGTPIFLVAVEETFNVHANGKRLGQARMNLGSRTVCTIARKNENRIRRKCRGVKFGQQGQLRGVCHAVCLVNQNKMHSSQRHWHIVSDFRELKEALTTTQR